MAMNQALLSPIIAYDDVEKLAKQILVKNGLDEKVPVDPIALAKMNDIDVKLAGFKEPGVAGAIIKENGHVTIFANKDDLYSQQRFTVAHELGHYYIHLLSENNKGIVDFHRTIDNDDENPIEDQANKFAAALLMDGILIKNIWGHFKSAEPMAKIFRVSVDTMEYRLKDLGLA